MAGRFSRSLELAKASWSVVRADKELLLLPVLSVAALILIVGSFVVPFAALGGFTAAASGGGGLRGLACHHFFGGNGLSRHLQPLRERLTLEGELVGRLDALCGARFGGIEDQFGLIQPVRPPAHPLMAAADRPRARASGLAGARGATTRASRS
jgi:hypothetical protein